MMHSNSKEQAMTKLTTESLEKFVNDIKTDGMCDITDYQVALALRQLLAYEQAAKNPVAYMHRSGQVVTRDETSCEEVFKICCKVETPLYAAPVLPKQPELLSIGELLQRLEEQTGEKWVEESGQSVIPDEINSAPDYVKALTKEGAYIYGWNECRAAAQPVIPEEKSAIHGTKAPEDIAFNNGFVAGWNCCRSEIISLNETTAQPVSELRARAIALYKPPFKFDHGYIWDADGRMVADNNLDEDGQILRVRGWGRISYLENAEALQDEVGEIIAIALSNYWNIHSAAAPAQESE